MSHNPCLLDRPLSSLLPILHTTHTHVYKCVPLCLFVCHPTEGSQWGRQWTTGLVSRVERGDRFPRRTGRSTHPAYRVPHLLGVRYFLFFPVHLWSIKTIHECLSNRLSTYRRTYPSPESIWGGPSTGLLHEYPCLRVLLPSRPVTRPTS